MKHLVKSMIYFAIQLSWVLKGKKRNAQTGNYSIGIVTYYRRFDKNLKPLIKHLHKIYPNSEIIIGVNGYYDQTIQQQFLKVFSTFISRFNNVKWFSYDTGQSLSKMWNQCILRSTNEWILILNDDVIITQNFRQSLDKIELQKDSIHVINSWWSHFFISKETIISVGWFDERLPGVGNEDWDYEIRAISQQKPIIDNKISEIINLKVETKDFSYSSTEKVVNKKYSNSNWEFFNKKWSISMKPLPDYIPTRFPEIPYVKSKPGMETPNFYNL